MNEFSVFIVIIILVVSILQIVLFIKIWQMTNDTAEIRKTLNVMLYRSLPLEKRKEKILNKYYKLFNEYGKITGGGDELQTIKIVSKTIDKYEKSIMQKIVIYDLADVYSIEELKDDMVKRYIKPK